jgi:hypothetical protein
MAETKSFHDILIEKMGTSESEKATFTEPNESSSPLKSTASHQSNRTHYNQAPFDLMSQLLGSTEATFFERGPEFSLLKTPYKAAIPLVKKVKPTPTEKTILITQLSLTQKLALEKLISLGASELRGFEIIGETRIKKCFRSLAKSLHPDLKQQSSQNFRELRESYNMLMSAFNKIESKAA